MYIKKLIMYIKKLYLLIINDSNKINCIIHSGELTWCLQPITYKWLHKWHNITLYMASALETQAYGKSRSHAIRFYSQSLLLSAVRKKSYINIFAILSLKYAYRLYTFAPFCPTSCDLQKFIVATLIMDRRRENFTPPPVQLIMNFCATFCRERESVAQNSQPRPRPHEPRLEQR